MLKCSTTPEMRLCSTLWNVVLKNCHAAELSEANCDADSAIETVDEKYLSSDIDVIFSLRKRYLQWPL